MYNKSIIVPLLGNNDGFFVYNTPVRDKKL